MIRPITAGDAEAVAELTVTSELLSAEEAVIAQQMMADYFTWELTMLGVRRDHHRQGRGATLLRHVEQELRARNQRLLLIETSAIPVVTGHCRRTTLGRTTPMITDAIVGVPVDSSGAFVGCERMPAALRAAGIATWDVPDHGNLQVTLADPVRDRDTGITAYRDLVNATATIRDAVRSLLVDGRTPLVIGGCCSLLIGTAAAVQDAHPGAALAFLDGHYDLYTGATSTTGEAADMELAIVLGVGPQALTHLTSKTRIVEAHQVVVIGPRDAPEAKAAGALDPATLFPAMAVHDLGAIRAHGAPKTATRALDQLIASADHPRPYWVHLDLDILSTEAFPAVDYPQDDGLTWEELTDIVTPLTHHEGFLGMNVTILNPTKDIDGKTADNTVRWLATVLT